MARLHLFHHGHGTVDNLYKSGAKLIGGDSGDANSGTLSDHEKGHNSTNSVAYTTSIRAGLNDLGSNPDGGKSLMVTNVLDALTPGNYLGTTDSGTDIGSLHNVTASSVESRGYMIIETPPFLQAYAVSQDAYSREQLLPIVKLITGGMIKSTPKGWINLSKHNRQANDVYKFIIKILISQSSLAFLSHSLISLPTPPSLESQVVETMTSHYPDRKMTMRLSPNIDAGSGTFTLEHNELAFDQVKTFYDIIYNWIYYSARNSLIKIPPEYFFPATIIHSCPIWQIMTKLDGVTVNRLYRYTGCIPGRAKYEENTAFNTGKVNKVSCEWSYNWCDYKSLSLMVLFNITMRNSKIEIEKSDKYLKMRELLGFDCSKGFYQQNLDGLRLAIVPIIRYEGNVVEDVLVMCLEKEWIGQMAKFDNLDELDKELSAISNVLRGREPTPPAPDTDKNSYSQGTLAKDPDVQWDGDDWSGVDKSGYEDGANFNPNVGNPPATTTTSTTTTPTSSGNSQTPTNTNTGTTGSPLITNPSNAKTGGSTTTGNPSIPTTAPTIQDQMRGLGNVVGKGSPIIDPTVNAALAQAAAEKAAKANGVAGSTSNTGGTVTPTPSGSGNTKPTTSSNTGGTTGVSTPSTTGSTTAPATGNGASVTPSTGGSGNTGTNSNAKPANTGTPTTNTNPPTGTTTTPATGSQPVTPQTSTTPKPTTPHTLTAQQKATAAAIKDQASNKAKPTPTPATPTTDKPTNTKPPEQMYSGRPMTSTEKRIIQEWKANGKGKGLTDEQILDKWSGNERDHRYDGMTNQQIVDSILGRTPQGVTPVKEEDKHIAVKHVASKPTPGKPTITTPTKVSEKTNGANYYNGHKITSSERSIINRLRASGKARPSETDQEVLSSWADNDVDTDGTDEFW